MYIKLSSFMCLMMLGMVGCPASVVSEEDTSSMTEDCRLSAYQCATGFSCEPDSVGSFHCVPMGDVNPMGGTTTDQTNENCTMSNGRCDNLEAPPVVGTLVQAFNFQGPDHIENCHAIYMPNSRGVANTTEGCETCTYAWNISYNLVYNSCNIDRVPTFDLPIGVDLIAKKISIFKDNAWTNIEVNSTGAVNNKSLAFARFERDPFGPTNAQAGDYYSGTQFVELSWQKASVSCGDFYCDYGDGSCPNDCLAGQNPASAYRFRSFGFAPESQEYQDCYSVAKLEARKEEALGGCDQCSERWYFQAKTVLSNCGSWSDSIGSVRRSDLGVRDTHQLVHAFPGREGYFDLTEQYSQYHPSYSSLLASFDSFDFEDINLNAEQEDEEPDRARTQVTVIHYE